MKHKKDAPRRGCQDVGAGDYVKIGQTWKKIESNTAEGTPALPRDWSIKTADGDSYTMWNVNRYAKAEDFE
jgi:hypothetical protein